MAAGLVIILAAVYPATASGSPPSHSKRQQRIDQFRSEVASARAKLDALNNRADIADENYLQAQAKLDQTTRRLAGARAAAKSAESDAGKARTDLSARVRAAYEGTGSTLGLLLGAQTYGQFSDRLEFMGQIAADDAAAVDRAKVAAQRAKWASDELASALKDNSAALESARREKASLQSAVDAQEQLLGSLQEKLRIALIPPPPPTPPPAPVIPTPSPTTQTPTPTTPPPTGEPTPDPTTAPPPPPPPPAPAPGAQLALDAAYSVIGVPYVYAGASPETGFDCSGLTMWAWAHAGVSLPHSSAMQYAVLPHVDRSQLEPGDLLFFYSPIHHVAMYVGGGRMIHAPHTGGHVEVIPVYWEYYVGAARPG
ncbi:MAG TPA: NlpC/P60 family protein [Actinomycetota bacterium]|jgi:cell wall-associated NlpC family hydrolase